MEVGILILVAVLASGMSYITLRGYINEPAGGIAGGILWFLAAFGATAYETTSRTPCCMPEAQSSPGVAFVFAAFGVLMWVIAFFGIETVVDMRGRMEDGPGSGR
jgi:amino acid transporter